ncbi:hypothetical protein JCM24511_09482 [Saitozyma sp. JCM 24511]|nr:hypothetical protein JCM24511_09482 [Saitozyma sp. JCM 24511]
MTSNRGRDVYLNRDKILKGSEDNVPDSVREILVELVAFVDSRILFAEQKRRELPEGTIVWPLLWWLMPSGTNVEGKHELHDALTAYTVDSWQYTMDDRGRAYVIKGHYFQWSGLSYQRMEVIKKIPEFQESVIGRAWGPLCLEGVSELRDAVKLFTDYPSLPVWSMRTMWGLSTLECWQDRKPGTAGNGGALTLRRSRVQGTGQVIIDVAGFRKANPTLDSWADDINKPSDPPHSGVLCPLQKGFIEDNHFLLPPSIHGFSLVAKRWGEFLIDNLQDRQWNGTAFDHLVIPDIYRRAVRGLVDVHVGPMKTQLISDVVSGKGQGLIIALHGHPGTGKTLTAEAVAEHLKRPLYMVSAGELGTNLTALERKLGELASSWNAVLLIDEADIFLERRSSADLERNALVGVFLRLLEYFSGVLILTTNRIENFDPAFASRFSLTLPFHDLDSQSRAVLWKNFIQLARPDMPVGQVQSGFDIRGLAGPGMNGRSIKQTVRTAQALALAENSRLEMRHLKEIVSISTGGSSSGTQ